jgi:hypothetical protein
MKCARDSKVEAVVMCAHDDTSPTRTQPCGLCGYSEATTFPSSSLLVVVVADWLGMATALLVANQGAPVCSLQRTHDLRVQRFAINAGAGVQATRQ